MDDKIRYLYYMITIISAVKNIIYQSFAIRDESFIMAAAMKAINFNSRIRAIVFNFICLKQTYNAICSYKTSALSLAHHR